MEAQDLFGGQAHGAHKRVLVVSAMVVGDTPLSFGWGAFLCIYSLKWFTIAENNKVISVAAF